MMKYFFANWKMYLKEGEVVSLSKILSKTKFSKSITVAAFPSSVHLHSLGKTLGRVALGVQDIGPTAYGASTGDVSPVEARRMKVKYCLIGHSERRTNGETDELIAKKFQAALQAKLIPVLCVGETAAERASGKAGEVVLRQLRSCLSGQSKARTNRFLIAYEPVWAIGTGAPADYTDVAAMHLLIRKEFDSTPILYGGSVNADTVAEYLKLPAVDGVLVGHASAKKRELSAILNALCS